MLFFACSRTGKLTIGEEPRLFGGEKAYFIIIIIKHFIFDLLVKFRTFLFLRNLWLRHRICYVIIIMQ